MFSLAPVSTRVACPVAGNRGGVASTSRTTVWQPVLSTSSRGFHRVNPCMAAASSTGKIEVNKAPPTPITLTDGATSHLKKLREERGEAKSVLRVGVKSGGCSGMSYTMDFINSPEEFKPDDMILNYDDGELEIRVDPKSLLYLFGLQLDYSSELIGGGYKFSNPNAASSCGCGTSFTV